MSEYEIYRNRIATGTDAKILQYEESAQVINDSPIDLKSLLNGVRNNNHCIVINIDKDVERYKSTVGQLKKISIDKFIHLKATYWKRKADVEKDLTMILEFLASHTDGESNIKRSTPPRDGIKINEFSEINDRNIYIQDGPLACYCSHLRAMMYGYINSSDYTIIVEDDISITNTDFIERYIQLIPNDWDIICLNSAPKNVKYDAPFYKYVNEFHSTHFYIVRNRCFPTLFKGMYPITDQVDVLISNLYNQLNIYNIVDTVYQKSIETNTQNNLHVMFNSPNYEYVRLQISNIKLNLREITNSIIPNNEERNEVIGLNIMYGILFNCITNPSCFTEKSDFECKYDYDTTNYVNELKDDEHVKYLLVHVKYLIRTCIKGIDIDVISFNIVNSMLNIIKGYKYHNNMINGIRYKAHAYGSTCQIYLSEDKTKICKAYNQRLRWFTVDHDNSEKIYEKELKMLLSLNKVIEYDKNNLTIILPYYGESLLDNFTLPSDWKNQICDIFDHLTKEKIFYREFRLENILIHNDKITFIDYGLSFNGDIDNEENKIYFMHLLELFEARFKNVNDTNIRHQLYTTFMNNNRINIENANIYQHRIRGINQVQL